MQFGGIGISNLPNQHCTNSTKKEHFYNIIVAGAKGLGKTTFLNNLVKKNVFSKSLFLEQKNDQKRKLYFFENGDQKIGKNYEIIKHEDSKITNDDLNENIKINNSKNLEYIDPNESIKYDDKEIWKNNWFEEYKMTFELTETEIIERGININFTVLEIDNIGDSICNENIEIPIIDYINKKYYEYFKNEQELRRDEIRDTRIHAVLYFFEPDSHNISDLDFHVLKEISKICSVIPIIGRSDMFTVEEREIIKSNFQEIILENKISFFKFLKNYPFFVVNNHIDEFGIVHERQYPWGSINANNKNISEIEELKNMIIRDHLLDVISESMDFYKKFRNMKLKQEILKYLKQEDKIKLQEMNLFERFLDEWCLNDYEENFENFENE